MIIVSVIFNSVGCAGGAGKLASKGIRSKAYSGIGIRLTWM
ncbi:MAG: hypothetical protein U9N46_06885 [Euryarchaeota archaeon]|nr:hypothetical protein [Euryarchaeota archaeon]